MFYAIEILFCTFITLGPVARQVLDALEPQGVCSTSKSELSCFRTCPQISCGNRYGTKQI